MRLIHLEATKKTHTIIVSSSIRLNFSFFYRYIVPPLIYLEIIYVIPYIINRHSNVCSKLISLNWL